MTDIIQLPFIKEECNNESTLDCSTNCLIIQTQKENVAEVANEEVKSAVADILREKCNVETMKKKCDLFVEHGELLGGTKTYKSVKQQISVESKVKCSADMGSLDNLNSKITLTCPFCQKKFEDINTFEKHKEIHIGGWPFTCHICHKGFLFYHILESHRAFHKNEVFPCDTCDKTCVSRYRLKNHMLKTHVDQFNCRICKESFSTNECLKNHKRIHKTGNLKKKIHICKICSATFPIHIELKIHQRMHSTDWPFCCNVCKKLYRRKGSFMTHVSKCTGNDPYVCDICDKTFIRQCHFVEHVQEFHKGVKPFNCRVCHKRFNSKSNLEIHSQVHSARLPTVYKCSLCQQMFNSSRKLRGHKIREHSLYRPYKCSTCKKHFLFKSQLSHHSKEHRVKEM